MDRFKDPFNSPTQTLKPARRRLQKGDFKTRSFFSKRTSQDSNASSLSIEGGLRNVTRQMGAVARPSLPVLSPDLGDAKWLEYVEPHDLTDTGATPRHQGLPVPDYPPPPPPLIPEFSHLAVSESTPRSPPEVPPTPASNRHSTISMMRRQAKTPVFKIGQLEKSAKRRRLTEAADRAAAEEAPLKPCSVELIAQSYRDLLESRDTDVDAESYTTAPSDHASSPAEGSHEYLYARPSSDSPRAGVTIELPPLENPHGLSPTSDDGTLVSFEEDAIYFKPVSFSPEPSPSPHRRSFDKSVLMAPPVQNDSSLKKSMDLLTRELSSTIAERRGSTPNDASSLQVWVMIEAYERLREQVTTLGLNDSELQSMRGVFDSWLGVLYKIHRSMANEAAASDSDYEGLEEEVD